MLRYWIALLFAPVLLASTVAAAPDDDVARGLKALSERDLVEAMDAFTAALEADPSHAVAAFERGVLLLQIGEAENAIADLTTAILTNPANGRAYAYRAEAKLLLKDGKSAIEDFFDRAYELEDTLRLKGKTDILDTLEAEVYFRKLLGQCGIDPVPEDWRERVKVGAKVIVM